MRFRWFRLGMAQANRRGRALRGYLNQFDMGTLIGDWLTRLLSTHPWPGTERQPCSRAGVHPEDRFETKHGSSVSANQSTKTRTRGES